MLFQRLLDDRRAYDAIVVFDADSRVDPVPAAQAALRSGNRVIQGRHVISNPDASTFNAGRRRHAAEQPHPQPRPRTPRPVRTADGGRHGLPSQRARAPWLAASSLAEDNEYGIHLASQGVRAVYAPWPVARARPRQAGRTPSPAPALVRRRVRAAAPLRDPLLAAAVRRRAAALDLALDLPAAPTPPSPRSGRAADGDLSRVGAGGHGALALARGCGRLLLLAAFPLIGLAAGAPASAFRALLHGPAPRSGRPASGCARRSAATCRGFECRHTEDKGAP